MSESCGADQARGMVKEISDLNIDDLTRISSFTPECIQRTGEHIDLEYKTWNAFKKLALDCCRANIALPGFALFFTHAAIECLADAVYLEKYVVQRGGIAQPTDIPAPKIALGDSPIEPLGPLRECLKMQRELLEDANRLCQVAGDAHDYALQDAVARRFLGKGTKHVKNMADMLQKAARVSKVPGHGLYHLDKELQVKLGRTPGSEANKPHSAEHLLERVAADMAALSSL